MRKEDLAKDGNVKDAVKMANKWRGAPVYGHATPFIRRFHVVFDVPVLRLNPPNFK